MIEKIIKQNQRNDKEGNMPVIDKIFIFRLIIYSDIEPLHICLWILNKHTIS